MSRETVQAKAGRYLLAGRVIVRAVDEYAGVVQADVRGDGAVHACGRDATGWFCTCKARGRCSHLLALGLVVAIEPREAMS